MQNENVPAGVDFWFSPLWLSLLLTTRTREAERERREEREKTQRNGLRVGQTSRRRGVKWEVGKRVSTLDLSDIIPNKQHFSLGLHFPGVQRRRADQVGDGEEEERLRR